MALIKVLIVFIILVSVHCHRRRHRHNPVDNPDLESAVSDFVARWEARHKQDNVDYEFSLRSDHLQREVRNTGRLSSRPLDTDHQHQTNSDNNLMNALTAQESTLTAEETRNQLSSLMPSSSSPPPTADSKECPVCNVSRETDKQLRIAMIQQQILRKLGLKEPPKFNASQHDLPNVLPLRNLFGPAYGLHNEYGANLQDDYTYTDDDAATVLKLVSFGEDLPKEKTPNITTISKQIRYFNFKNDNTKARVSRAILWVYLRPARMGRMNNSTHVDIYRLGPPNERTQRLTGYNVYSRLIHPSAEGGWYSFDMKQVVLGWIRNPANMYGIQVEALDSEENDLPVMKPRNPSEISKKPIIELRFSDIRTRKKRRIEEHCSESQNITKCCLYPLTVDFAQMGWTFILNPRTYKANYCSGECPNVYKQNFQHTHVVQQAYSAKKPCCAPKTMKAVSFLYYYSNSNIVYGLVPDMSVESCTCV